MIGQTVSHYRIIEELGSGGMGIIYKAEDLTLGRQVALKFLSLTDDLASTRFLREARTASALNHPNICTIYEIGEHEDRPFIAMELLQGHTLEHEIGGRPLPINTLLDLSIQIADALDAAHAKGLVHRDVKPSNVLLDADDHVYVADLGIGRRLEEAQGVGEERSVGTPAYLAPEELQGLPVDGRADVYSLGCLFFECLTGEPPFRARGRF